jgi:citrate lyase beta subunit
MTPRTSLPAETLAAFAARLAPVDEELARRYPGDPIARQPVHTVYVPADRFGRGTPSAWGAAALELLDAHAPGPDELAAAVGAEPGPASPDPLRLEDAGAVYARVLDKLRREPVEDLRIDFEDGYGVRHDGEEDADAARAAAELAAARAAGEAPPYVGVRIKCLEAAHRARAARTLDIFLTELLAAGPLPSGFVVTLPKVSMAEQVTVMVDLCEALEDELDLASGVLRFEVQVETPQAVFGAEGLATVPRLIAAARGRCVALPFGTYDYSAACGISPADQSLDHPVADFAKAVMQVAAAGTGVRVVDGSTNVLPVGDAGQVRSAWRLHHRLVRRGLRHGFAQGWDLHPGQLPTRFAAVFGFYREGLPAAAARLRAYLDGLTGGPVADEPATARALAGYLLRGLDCGAVGEAEVADAAGCERDSLAALAGRRA